MLPAGPRSLANGLPVAFSPRSGLQTPQRSGSAHVLTKTNSACAEVLTKTNSTRDVLGGYTLSADSNTWEQSTHRLQRVEDLLWAEQQRWETSETRVTELEAWMQRIESCLDAALQKAQEDLLVKIQQSEDRMSEEMELAQLKYKTFRSGTEDSIVTAFADSDTKGEDHVSKEFEAKFFELQQSLYAPMESAVSEARQALATSDCMSEKVGGLNHALDDVAAQSEKGVAEVRDLVAAVEDKETQLRQQVAEMTQDVKTLQDIVEDLLSSRSEQAKRDDEWLQALTDLMNKSTDRIKELGQDLESVEKLAKDSHHQVSTLKNEIEASRGHELISKFEEMQRKLSVLDTTFNSTRSLAPTSEGSRDDLEAEVAGDSQKLQEGECSGIHDGLQRLSVKFAAEQARVSQQNDVLSELQSGAQDLLGRIERTEMAVATAETDASRVGVELAQFRASLAEDLHAASISNTSMRVTLEQRLSVTERQLGHMSTGMTSLEDYIKNLLQKLDIPVTLQNIGTLQCDLPQLASSAGGYMSEARDCFDVRGRSLTAETNMTNPIDDPVLPGALDTRQGPPLSSPVTGSCIPGDSSQIGIQSETVPAPQTARASDSYMAVLDQLRQENQKLRVQNAVLMDRLRPDEAALHASPRMSSVKSIQSGSSSPGVPGAKATSRAGMASSQSNRSFSQTWHGVTRGQLAQQGGGPNAGSKLGTKIGQSTTASPRGPSSPPQPGGRRIPMQTLSHAHGTPPLTPPTPRGPSSPQPGGRLMPMQTLSHAHGIPQQRTLDIGMR